MATITGTPKFQFCPRCGTGLQPRNIGGQERSACGPEGWPAGMFGLQMNQVIIAYHVRATGTIQLGEELRACKRIGKQQLRPWHFGTGLAVRDWLQRHGSTTA